MDRLEAIQIFSRVAEMASFTRAADSLGLPKASVSTAVQQLESALGARLLHRTTRRVELTQDGRAFYERARDLLADMDELNTMFQRGEASLRGRLRIDMPSRLGYNFVIPKLPHFLDAHPHLELEISSTDRKVDLVREGFDCVIRVGDPGEGGLVARRLGYFRIVHCVSPAYIRRFGTPHTLDDLADHHLIHYVPTLGAKSSGFEYFADGDYKSLPMQGSVTVNNSDAYQAACLAGLGVIQVPVAGVRHLFESGQLVEILPQVKAEPMPLSLIYAHRRNLSKRLQIFMEWLAEILRPHLEKHV
jgi:DNA-binding transcriptional LysR family regulator